MPTEEEILKLANFTVGEVFGPASTSEHKNVRIPIQIETNGTIYAYVVEYVNSKDYSPARWISTNIIKD